MNGKINPRMGTIRAIFPKIRARFSIFNKGQRKPLLSPLVVRWMLLNMHQYPWISLKILENAWINCSDDVRTLNMPHHRTCSTGGWDALCSKCDRVLIWHSCLCNGYREFWICLNMAQYVSIMPKYDSVCLNAPKYAWTWLNIA